MRIKLASITLISIFLISSIVLNGQIGSDTLPVISSKMDTIPKGDLKTVVVTNQGLPKSSSLQKASPKKSDLSLQTGNLNEEEINVENLGYSGYRIVIQLSRHRLKKEAELYQKEKNIHEYKTKQKNYLYMLGAYTSYEEAVKVLESELKSKYPLAYVVEFTNGVRTK